MNDGNSRASRTHTDTQTHTHTHTYTHTESHTHRITHTELRIGSQRQQGRGEQRKIKIKCKNALRRRRVDVSLAVPRKSPGKLPGDVASQALSALTENHIDFRMKNVETVRHERILEKDEMCHQQRQMTIGKI